MKSLRKMHAAAMLAPAAAFFLLSFFVPLVRVVQLSFLKTDYVTTQFVGLRNYILSFSDPDFLKTFFTAGVYVVMVVPISIIISYRLSVDLSTLGRRGRTALQTIYYLPSLTAGIIISLVWQWVFGRSGLIGTAMAAVGLEPIGWFSNGWTARVVISFAVVFSAIGGNCIWLCAVLLSISREIYDVATVDGANPAQISRYITRPLMIPTLSLLAMLQAIGTLQYWEVIYAITSGGPYKMTASTVFDIYTTAFIYGRHGYAAAKSVVLIIVVAVLVGGRKLMERRS